MPKPRTGWIERHGSGWRLQVRVDGERIRRTFRSCEQAELELEKILCSIEEERESALAKKLGTPTVANVVDEYYERRKPHLEDSTKARYDNVLNKYVLPMLGPLDARDLAASPVLLQDFLDSIPWGSARKALEVLGPALRMAHDNAVIASDPTTKIRRPKRPDRKRKKEIPTPGEVEKLIIAAYERDVWWGYYVELTATLGTRRSETAALRWEDFTFPGAEKHGRIAIRRAIGKKNGGIYIKAPKSGLERTLLVHRSLFDGLGRFEGETGWLFPGRSVRPRRDPSMVTIDSTPGRLIVWLHEHGGAVACPSGRVGARARHDIGTNSATFSQVVKELRARRLIERDANARRTFCLALTASGSELAKQLAGGIAAVDFPVHPDTMGHRFEEMAVRLGLLTPSGRPYTLHALRHFRATHLYNHSKDWVQVARYLGHTSPAITMDLYANNVVQPTQAMLADAAVCFDSA